MPRGWRRTRDRRASSAAGRRVAKPPQPGLELLRYRAGALRRTISEETVGGLHGKVPLLLVVGARQRAAARELAGDALPEAVGGERQPARGDRVAQLRKRAVARRCILASRQLGQRHERRGEIGLVS